MLRELTLTQVARRVGSHPAAVAYAIQKAGIREKSRAGIIRIFGEDQLDEIMEALRNVRHRRPGLEASPVNERGTA